MRKFFGKKIFILLAIVGVMIVFLFIYLQHSSQQTVSAFGKYQGYTEQLYNGTQRTSEYLTLSDGTRLAYDLILPTKDGVPPSVPLPFLFKYTPYGRTWTIFDKQGNLLISDFVDLPTQIMARARYLMMGEAGRIMDPLWRDKWLDPLVKHGYVILSVDRPGTGASFSSPTPGSMETAAKFENEIINWIAAQPWSDGNVGMYGDSQQAMVQFAAASTGNPHLKAILPAASDIEIYEAVEYPGGVYNKAFATLYAIVPLLDKVASPVDSDPDGVVLAQAIASRRNLVGIQNANQVTIQSPYRDSLFHDSQHPGGSNPWEANDLYPFIDRINQSHTAIYMTVGWYDIFTADMFYWYNNVSVPKRLTVRPTDHSQVSANLSDLDYGAEALRWFDYWLKGIHNGIMDEPPIHYYVIGAPQQQVWQTADKWPLPNQHAMPFYFGEGKTGSIASVNDGSLVPQPPTLQDAFDTYTVDYTTSSGQHPRWGAVDAPHEYPDMRSNDAKAITYSTPPLESDILVTGHPVVHLWLTADVPDVDTFVYLEQVDPLGKSTYITEGVLRASHRKLSVAPFNNLGLPYHSHYQSDLETLVADEPTELVLSLLPTAYQFHQGDHIRITVAFADNGNFDTPVLNPTPVLKILRDKSHPSYVEVPIYGNNADSQ